MGMLTFPVNVNNFCQKTDKFKLLRYMNDMNITEFMN